MLACAIDVARRHGCARVGLEHVLLAICRGEQLSTAPLAAQAERLGVPCARLRAVLESDLSTVRRVGWLARRRSPDVSPAVGLALRHAQRAGRGFDVRVFLAVVLAGFDEPAAAALREVGLVDLDVDVDLGQEPGRPAAARRTPVYPDARLRDLVGSLAQAGPSAQTRRFGDRRGPQRHGGPGERVRQVSPQGDGDSGRAVNRGR